MSANKNDATKGNASDNEDHNSSSGSDIPAQVNETNGQRPAKADKKSEKAKKRGRKSSSDSDSESEDAPKAKKAKGAKRSKAAEKKKHAPVSKRGTTFLIKDNLHINQTPFKKDVNRENELKFVLKSKKGEKFTYKYKNTMDWNDQKMITKLNSWRRQIFRRSLHQKRAARPHWSVREQQYVTNLVKKRLRSTRKELTTRDWKVIAAAHNKRYQGKTLKTGEDLARSISFRTRLLSASGQKLSKEQSSQPLPKRSALTIQGMVKRWPDSLAIINGVLASLGLPQISGFTSKGNAVAGKGKAADKKSAEVVDEDEGEDEDEDEEGEDEEEEDEEEEDEEEEESDEEEPGFEDESSDEDEGRRPVKDPNAGRLVSAC